MLSDGATKRTWTTHIEVRTEEVVKQVEGQIKKEKIKRTKRTKKDKKDKENSSSDDSTDSDESDIDKVDPIRELAKLTGFGGSVIGPSDP